MNFSANKPSTSEALVASTWSATFATNVLNLSFFATKSVSEFTSTIAAFLSSSTIANTAPSAAILPAFFTAVASPFFLNN